MSDRWRCPICDEWYDPEGERAMIHQHEEPQGGPARDAWLASRLSYVDWISTTIEGKRWVVRKEIKRGKV